MEVTYESLKVMVIDDSKTIRRTAETLLKKAGCMVITATDGFDALAKIGWLPDLCADQEQQRIQDDPGDHAVE
jgi:CheY-like chemotaxis protein